MVFSWLFPSKQNRYCNRDFPKVWSAFVDSLTDTFHVQGPVAPPPSSTQVQTPLVLPPTRRLVAIGDVHGDLEKTRKALLIAGVINQQGHWVGGDTVCVQIGDVLDRGDKEIETFYLLERLRNEAARAGGAVYVLNGNHETMNVAGRFRYATPGGIARFYEWQRTQYMGHRLKEHCGCGHKDDLQRVWSILNGQPHTSSEFRTAALKPGGDVTRRFLANQPVVLQVGSTVFVHGGILPQHVEYGLERINRETREWMLSPKSTPTPAFLTGREAIVWVRDYSHEDASKCDCDKLGTVLDMIPGAKRMVVGHTIQEQGINSACDNRVFRIDVGMSKGCTDGEPQVLEITNDSNIRLLREAKRGEAAAAARVVEGTLLGAFWGAVARAGQGAPGQV